VTFGLPATNEPHHYQSYMRKIKHVVSSATGQIISNSAPDTAREPGTCWAGMVVGVTMLATARAVRRWRTCVSAAP